MFTKTLKLADKVFIRNGADGKAINLELAKLSDVVLAAIIEGGAKIVLTNAYNGGGKDKTEGEKEAQLRKRMDSWYAGNYVQVERGESQYTAMREQYYDERKAAAGQTRAQVDAAIKALVVQVFGDKEPATFSRFLDAVATVKAKDPANEGIDVADIRETIESDLNKRTVEAAKARAEVAAQIVVPDMGL